MKLKLIISFLVLASIRIFPQACCSAGTPLLSSLELSTSQKGALQIGLSYEFNYLDDVIAGTTKQLESFRTREGHSVILETSYGFTERISVTALFTFLNQRRINSTDIGAANRLSTTGISDAVMLVKYNLVPLSLTEQYEVSLGAGVKFPFGESTLRNSGILLPADLQPGTGSWDGLLWGYVSKGFVPVVPLNVFLNVSYRMNGTNDRFGAGFQGYKFGNELILNAGAGYRTDTFFDFSFILRFRNTAKDEFSSEDVPNTGGNWLYGVPGVNGKISENLTARLSGQVPLYRNLSGVQLTTTYSLRFALFYTINDI